MNSIVTIIGCFVKSLLYGSIDGTTTNKKLVKTDDEGRLEIVSFGGAETNLPSVQARRTTNFITTTSFADVPLDTTDEETDSSILEHNTVTTSRVEIKESGLYVVHYHFTGHVDHTASVDFTFFGRINKNDSTPLDGLDISAANHFSGSGSFSEDPQLSGSIVVSLTANDYIELQVRHTVSITPDTIFIIEPTLVVARLKSVRGIQGATGAAGDFNWRGAWDAGTTYSINDVIENNGSSFVCILGHINFEPPNVIYWELVASIGATGPAAPVVPFGTEYQSAESLSESTTTSGTFQQKLRLTTASLPAGDYVVMWSSDVGNTTSDKEFAAQFEENDTTALGNLGLKAKETTSPTNNLEVTFSGHAIRTLSGVNTFDIDFAAGNATATIRNARITLWRVT